MQRTVEVCPARTLRHWPDLAFHTRRVRSVDPLITRSPTIWEDHTPPEWPTSVRRHWKQEINTIFKIAKELFSVQQSINFWLSWRWVDRLLQDGSTTWWSGQKPLNALWKAYVLLQYTYFSLYDEYPSNCDSPCQWRQTTLWEWCHHCRLGSCCHRIGGKLSRGRRDLASLWG